jgi:hypothetical protein
MFILRRFQGDVIINFQVFMHSTCYYCKILMKLELSQQILDKFSNIKFH